ncbi:Efflux transporter outer membrane subunit [Sulfidibacter corallicola]|uniref:Efflux transporter outer membrane subunit n=1 Tax=Sulfidibacter corallicola TaxID=2818388 RepID=A0A8A4TP77_SULCO|nr:efflux transporter outer membrane subunit [Sulfidibacter corallicola]QTD50768.1 efflux transporter outer membrane subunit [Sulfidibacter corallicola]
MNRRMAWVTIVFTLFLSACSVGRKYVEPDVQNFDTGTFGEVERQEDSAARAFRTAEPVAAWWHQFDDPQLADLVDTALAHNHDVRAALANLREARALLRSRKLDRLPTVESQASGSRQQVSADSGTGTLPDRNWETYAVGLDAIWEADLFGRVSQRIASASASLDIREADLHGVYVSVAAETASTYIEYRGLQYRLQVAQRNADNQEQTYRLTVDLADAGRSDQLNVARAQTQLELTRSTIPLLEAQRDAVLHRLGVLTGALPTALFARLQEVKALPSLPDAVDVGDPLGLLTRRPDIRRAERELALATAQYNLQVAELYPEVRVSGSIGFSATAFDNLGSSGTSVYSFGPSIRWAAFNLGRVRRGIEAADARTDASLASFEKTVLLALEEVETSLVDFNKREQSRAKLLLAARAGAQASEYAKLRFNAGIDNFLDVLDAERTLLDAQERLARSETEVALSLVGIYKALGGGWQAPVIQANAGL